VGRTALSEPTRISRSIASFLSTDVEFHLIDTGHFALEDKADEIVLLIRDFLGRKVARQ
jgi:hypothetical protein